MIPYRLMVTVFVLAALAYVAAGWTTFTVPLSLEDAEACGFTSADFGQSGRIEYPATQAWWLSFVRKQEYWSALCAGMACAFVAFALFAMRRLGTAGAGTGVAAGAAAGGGVLALGALCIGCLAPMLSVVGLGIGGTLLSGIPKWLMALNTFLLTGWGTLFLSRRLAACPVMSSPCAQSPTVEEGSKG
jgi:hypothetical protein